MEDGLGTDVTLASPPPAVERRAGRSAALRAWLRQDAFGLLMSQWTLANVAQLGVVSIQSLYLLNVLQVPPAVAGTFLLFASLSFRVARFLVLPVLDRLDPKVALLLCIGAAAGGCAALSLLPQSMLVMVPAVLLLGVGYGTNLLLVKVLVAGRAETRLVRYSSLNVCVNVGAALGPGLLTWLFFHLGPRAAFAAAGCCYLAAAAVMLRYPSPGSRDPAESVDWLRALRSCLAIPRVRRAMLVYVCLHFMATQLYAVLPLAATRMLNATDLLGAYFALNAVLVVVAQIPVTRAASALRVAPGTLVKLGFASYGLGFLALWLWPSWQAAFLMVVGCSLAEVLLPPGMDTIMAGVLPARLRLSGFSLTAAASALGEGAGLSIGVGAAGYLAITNQLQAWYGILAASAAVAVVLAAVLLGRGTSARRS